MATALVTGANSGIGRATSLRLAEEGLTVYAGMRNLDSGSKLMTLAEQQGVEIRPLEVDVTDEGSVRDAVDQTNGVDVLVNNAGISENGTVEESTVTDLQHVFDVNVCGMVRCVRAVMPHMRQMGQGNIVNIASIVGRVAMGAQGPYVASKWAVEGLSEELALEVAPFGVRVSIIEPGVTKTAIFAKGVKVPPSTGAYDAAYRRMFQFFTKGISVATPASDVADTIYHAISTDDPRLRYVCSWGGKELVGGRAGMTDEQWVGLGLHKDDADYYKAFAAAFDLDIAPEPAAALNDGSVQT